MFACGRLHKVISHGACLLRLDGTKPCRELPVSFSWTRFWKVQSLPQSGMDPVSCTQWSTVRFAGNQSQLKTDLPQHPQNRAHLVAVQVQVPQLA